MTLVRANDTLVHALPRGALPVLSLAVAVALASLLPLPARASGVTAAILPDSGYVSPGSEFSLELWLTSPGDSIDGFAATVEYAPAALTFLQASPLSFQEGAYMKTPPACGNTAHYFTSAADSLVISDVLLCGGTGLVGPGQLYKLRFRAPSAPQWTWVRIRRIQFYRRGLFVDPAHPSDAAVAVGVPVDVPVAGAVRLETRVSVAPNPCRTAAAVIVETAAAGMQQVVVCDVQGRAVRHLDRAVVGAGTRRIGWDGRDDAGVRLAPGVYRVLVTTSGKSTGARMVLLP
jgi:hypothetical protein